MNITVHFFFCWTIRWMTLTKLAILFFLLPVHYDFASSFVLFPFCCWFIFRYLFDNIQFSQCFVRPFLIISHINAFQWVSNQMTNSKNNFLFAKRKISTKIQGMRHESNSIITIILEILFIIQTNNKVVFKFKKRCK